MPTESLFEAVGWEVAQRTALKNNSNSGPAINAVRLLRHGDSSALNALAESSINSLIDKKLGAESVKAQAAKNDSLIGGITLKEARDIFRRSSSIEFAKKNLFYLSVIDVSNGGGELADFNLFATDVSYSPVTISGEAVRVGSGSFDTVQNGERVEMRVTTMDDRRGTLKRWFKDRANRICRHDGTHGLPINYLLRVRVVHAFIADDDKYPDAFFDEYIMRPGSIEYDLSRKDDALQELQMTFVQFDTFASIE